MEIKDLLTYENYVWRSSRVSVRLKTTFYVVFVMSLQALNIYIFYDTSI